MTQSNSVPSGGPSVTPTLSQPSLTMIETAQLARRVKSGASMFYYVAGLSLLNTLLTIFNAGRYFVIGLAVSLFVDGVFLGIAEAHRAKNTRIRFSTKHRCFLVLLRWRAVVEVQGSTEEANLSVRYLFKGGLQTALFIVIICRNLEDQPCWKRPCAGFAAEAETPKTKPSQGSPHPGDNHART